MKTLNLTVYSSLKDYKETYEFYQFQKQEADFCRLQVIQGLWNKDVNDNSIAA